MKKTNTRKIKELLQNKDLWELLSRKDKYSWYSENSYSKYIKDTVWELLELQEWIDNWDIENIEEEVMDCVMMFWQLLNKLMSDNLIDWLDFNKHKNKIVWRSPNLKPWKYIWLTEEHRIWQLTKQKNGTT